MKQTFSKPKNEKSHNSKKKKKIHIINNFVTQLVSTYLIRHNIKKIELKAQVFYFYT